MFNIDPHGPYNKNFCLGKIWPQKTWCKVKIKNLLTFYKKIQPWWLGWLKQSEKTLITYASGGSNPIWVWCINRSEGETPLLQFELQNAGQLAVYNTRLRLQLESVAWWDGFGRRSVPFRTNKETESWGVPTSHKGQEVEQYMKAALRGPAGNLWYDVYDDWNTDHRRWSKRCPP